MKEILNTMLSALTRGEGVMLCSILKADGSSPRGAGAHMAVFFDGTALGTVERQSILLARELLKGKRNALRDFALHPEAANSTGMVCGGDVTVWFQYIPPENAAQIGVLRAWRDALGSGRNVWLCLVLDGETLREFRLLTADELRHGTEGFFTSRPYWDGSTFVEPIVRAGRVYLFGAGHVGRALAPVLRYAIKYKLGRATFDQMEYGVGKLCHGYLSELAESLEFEELVNAFWDQNMKRIKPWYEPREDDVILTASFDQQAQTIPRTLRRQRSSGRILHGQPIRPAHDRHGPTCLHGQRQQNPPSQIAGKAGTEYGGKGRS